MNQIEIEEYKKKWLMEDIQDFTFKAVILYLSISIFASYIYKDMKPFIVSFFIGTILLLIIKYIVRKNER